MYQRFFIKACQVAVKYLDIYILFIISAEFDSKSHNLFLTKLWSIELHAFINE